LIGFWISGLSSKQNIPEDGFVLLIDNCQSRLESWRASLQASDNLSQATDGKTDFAQA
jgi:hypothetical protein